MRVLFVDDEPRVLEGIERMLFHLADEWDITCVESGAAALHELEEAPYNVVVTDMRMPGMDGAALLREICQHFPHIIRIVLSGHAELESALRASMPSWWTITIRRFSASIRRRATRRLIFAVRW